MASNATISIQIVDENDNLPVFLLSQYSGSISEAAPVNSIVRSSANNPLVIRATDADSNQNALLVYQIVESTAKKYFTVDSSTGAIRTIANLDHETIAHFHFHVHVRDNGNPQLTAESPVEVTIEVTDINDNPPVFSQAVFETVLLLPTYVGVEVLKVKATDPDSEVPPELTYSLIEGNVDHFLIDSSTGVLTIKNNTLSKDHYMLIVRVSDGKFYSTAMVTIMLKEAMDSGLHFTQSFYSTSISENSTNITKVAVVNAVGNRLNEPLKYGILNPGNKFMIKSTSGVIETTGIPFDREKQELYELVVEASRELDHLRVTRVVVRVNIEDINDNAPVFVGLPYYAAVQVDAEPGTLIYRVTAIDKDKGANGEVSYLLKEDYGHFEIDRQTGSVNLREAFNSDLSNIEYLVIILAKDGGNPSLSASVELLITIVNKAMPVFDKPFYTASVNEDIEMHTPILSINATSPEGQGIIYIIVDGDPYNQFNIDFDTGILSVISPLDYENPLEGDISIFLRALDGGGRTTFCTVRVIVVDENDNTPQFMTIEYRASVKADVGKGHLVTQVQALDLDDGANSRITYSLYSEASVSVADLLEIDPDNGWMVTKGNFNQLKNTVLSFFVKAVDGGIPMKHSLIPVYIHVLPPEAVLPSFSQPQYSFTIPEDTVIGSTLDILHVLPSQGAVYSTVNGELAENNKEGIFIIDQDTGIIKLDKKLDHETNPAFHFKVAATIQLDKVDIVLTVDVEVKVLDVNDNKPVFEAANYEAVIMEGMPTGINLIQVKAIDADWGANGQVTYTLSAESELDKIMEAFTIDGNSGWISTLKDLDHEKNPTFTFAVVASDLGEAFSLSSTTLVSVTVTDINDNAPIFEHEVYRGSVKESDPPGEVVAVLNTWDEDTSEVNRQVSYHITGKNVYGVNVNLLLIFFPSIVILFVPIMLYLLPFYFQSKIKCLYVLGWGKRGGGGNELCLLCLVCCLHSPVHFCE
uniref:Cadherin domain-containing protein n=1 Tax=Gopherus evgoodei TaxID=1825980 RepID=A0A8C4VKY9_9SAUR